MSDDDAIILLIKKSRRACTTLRDFFCFSLTTLLFLQRFFVWIVIVVCDILCCFFWLIFFFVLVDGFCAKFLGLLFLAVIVFDKLLLWTVNLKIPSRRVYSHPLLHTFAYSYRSALPRVQESVPAAHLPAPRRANLSRSLR